MSEPLPSVEALGQVLAEPRRLRMLQELLGGVPLPAGALAARIGVAPSTVSGHLARLQESGLVRIEQRGRTRYARLAGPDVADAVETLLRMTSEDPVSSWSGSDRQLAMRRARSCYDHLAGDLGIALTDLFVARRWIDSDVGSARASIENISQALRLRLQISESSRPLVRGCPDWTARRPHLAGRLGAAILSALLSEDWLARRRHDRALRVTDRGQERFAALDLTY
ncbi:metalloregulator ArsR/SmtB family transcription factor [Microbacterium sp.]|uniref:ArsR/SmtB family transcription factor n=1 Tax=Microbacterium sp. TaxID=51671 RepID=UPI002627B2BF|nr:metalloregulator ArsR/SmtB family transcription factor [Microbacterium sp.]